jgi:hypothetical protein
VAPVTAAPRTLAVAVALARAVPELPAVLRAQAAPAAKARLAPVEERAAERPPEPAALALARAALPQVVAVLLPVAEAAPAALARRPSHSCMVSCSRSAGSLPVTAADRRAILSC